jgi:hypothetical protein
MWRTVIVSRRCWACYHLPQAVDEFSKLFVNAVESCIDAVLWDAASEETEFQLRVFRAVDLTLWI